MTEDNWQYLQPAAIVAKAVVGGTKSIMWCTNVFPDLARSSA